MKLINNYRSKQQSKTYFGGKYSKSLGLCLFYKHSENGDSKLRDTKTMGANFWRWRYFRKFLFVYRKQRSRTLERTHNAERSSVELSGR